MIFLQILKQPRAYEKIIYKNNELITRNYY